MRALLHGSELPSSHRDDPRVQDPYSLRCIPQVLGAARDALAFVEQVIANELGAVTDNPLLFSEDNQLLSGGNFSQPLATALDVLTIARAQIAGFPSDAPCCSAPGVPETPTALTLQPGVQSGSMIVQYIRPPWWPNTRWPSRPQSPARPPSAGMEDWNSMGATGALQAQQAIDLARNVVAIERLCAAQALNITARYDPALASRPPMIGCARASPRSPPTGRPRPTSPRWRA